jgi:uncharacterized membrane protein YhaH (DUF805 family)
MDFQSLFLSPNGRIGRQEFWIGMLILFAAHVVVLFIPFVNLLVPWFFLYCGICVYAKRLHDMGKSAWLVLIPFGVGVVAVILALILGGAAIVAASVNHENGQAASDASAGAAAASIGIMVLLMGVAGLIHLAFLLWCGIAGTQPGDNRFGSPSPTTSGTIASANAPVGGHSVSVPPAAPPSEPPAPPSEPPAV